LKQVKVLLVDDDASVRSVLKLALSVQDDVMEVREAADGVTALAICADFRPDVVVLDYWMPRMDGGEAARGIRALHPEARIISFSGVIEAKPDWADDYIVKGEWPDIAVLTGREGLTA
jgi:chemotaxis response regulator CheB